LKITVKSKVKNIRLLDPEFISDDHDIDCKIDAFGAMKLKSSVIKKISYNDIYLYRS